MLTPHPDCPPPPGVALDVGWALETNRLTIDYRVTDLADAIRWPAPASGRTDDLWQHSCFEAFIGSETTPAYAEFNVSPSTAWAAYAFDGYRAGMRNLDRAIAPVITAATPGHWRASLDLTGIEPLVGSPPWRLALTAVIEAKDGTKSYWSLAHPPGAPDFHHADCFAARLG